MKLERCKVKECGAMVYHLPVEGGTIAVNPGAVEVVVPEADDGFRIVSGYRPHWTTCVDISGRGGRSRA